MKGHSIHLHPPGLHLTIRETLIALFTLGATIGVIMLGVSILQSATEAPRIEADSSPISSGIQPSSHDVQLVVDHASKLSLTPAQRMEIGGVHASWLAEKRRIESEMRAAESAAQARMRSSRGESGVSLNALVSGTRSYAELEEEYCAKRLDHWRQAMSYLTPFQRGKLQDALARYD